MSIGEKNESKKMIKFIFNIKNGAGKNDAVKIKSYSEKYMLQLKKSYNSIGWLSMVIKHEMCYAVYVMKNRGVDCKINFNETTVKSLKYDNYIKMNTIRTI